MQKDVVVTLCLLEKYFPPSFFTIMVHLIVHLIREIEFCGPVHLRNRPEGCTVENYIAEEAIEFCSEFIAGVSSIGLNSSVIKWDSNMHRALSASSFIRPSKEQLDQTHLYVIQNHMESLHKLNSSKAQSKKWIQEEHNRSFNRWLSTWVALALEVPKNFITPSLRWIAHGPSADVATYSSYMINGYYYHIKRSGVKVDELGFTIVDLKRIGHKSDSFILATQAKQVFYVQDSSNPKWSVVVTSPQRTIEEDFFEDEIGDMLQECGYGTIQRMPNVDTPNETGDTTSTYIRHDCEIVIRFAIE
ncbi:transposase [Cucumis melo var. makuwa]|uniref:Transposase n=1 Tax=Cucumis melo var. makuwa TaxID=1194695 RepID=A0A5D3CSQ9_CUCMM|nr:transposase [Cucumis melo var. makuwa]